MIRIKLCSVKVRGFLAGKITLLPGKILGVEHKILQGFFINLITGDPIGKVI